MSNNGTSQGQPQTAYQPAYGAAPRVDWVDYAKGICIVMVVTMHSTLGVEAAAGRESWMHHLVAFAKPFRMPDFFLISGLFLSRVIDRDWRTYLDRKVVHFFYFYILWVAIQFAFKSPVLIAEQGWKPVALMYLETFIEPFGTLWFIYMLPVFFVVTKAARRVPPLLIWLAAAAFEMSHVETGWTLIDEFAARFVYFYSGYLFAANIFALTDRARAHPRLALGALAAWFAVNGALVFSGFSGLPLVSLSLGFAGACAIVVIGVLLAKMKWLETLRTCGEHSLVIYLAFFLPMAATRAVLLKTNIVPDIGLVSLIVTIAGVAGAWAIHWWAMRTGLDFLFQRPDAFWIAPKKPRSALQAAE